MLLKVVSYNTNQFLTPSWQFVRPVLTNFTISKMPQYICDVLINCQIGAANFSHHTNYLLATCPAAFIWLADSILGATLPTIFQTHTLIPEAIPFAVGAIRAAITRVHRSALSELSRRVWLDAIVVTIWAAVEGLAGYHCCRQLRDKEETDKIADSRLFWCLFLLSVWDVNGLIWFMIQRFKMIQSNRLFLHNYSQIHTQFLLSKTIILWYYAIIVCSYFQRVIHCIVSSCLVLVEMTAGVMWNVKLWGKQNSCWVDTTYRTQ